MVDTKFKNRLTPADSRSVFMRSHLFQGSWNFERMQALGVCFAMVPVIRRLYPENSDDRKQAIKRHLEFFNTHPYAVAPVLGFTMAIEEGLFYAKRKPNPHGAFAVLCAVLAARAIILCLFKEF